MIQIDKGFNREGPYLRLALWFLLLTCVGYELVKAIYLRTTILEISAYALFCLLVLLIAMRRMFSNWHRIVIPKHIIAIALVCIGAAIYPFFGVMDLYHYAKDIVMLITFGASFFLVRYGSTVYSEKYWGIFVFSLIFIGVIAFLIGGDGRRFEPPSMLIVPYLIMLTRKSKNIAKTAVCLVVCIFCLWLSYQSGQRAAFILIAISILFSFSYFESDNKRATLIMFVGFFLLAVLAYSADLVAIFSESRFDNLLERRLDGSLFVRFLEVQDVFNSWANLNLFQKIFGAGAGALYDPVLIFHNENMLVQTVEGLRRYHVHVTPFAVLLRFGLIGFVLFIVLFISVCVRVFRLRSKSRALLPMFISLALFLYLLKSLFFYVPADPVFWLLVACYFGTFGNDWYVPAR